MKVSRRIAAIGGVSLVGSAALTSTARAEFAQWLEGIGEGLEDFWIATEAYIYGYPLVTMEMTRRVDDQRRRARGDQRPDGPDDQAARISERQLSAMSPPPTPTRSTPLPSSMSAKSPGSSAFRRWATAMPCSRCWMAGPTVFQVPGKRTTGTGCTDLRHHRPGLDGNAADGRQGIQIARRASSGCSAASTAPARRRTTRSSMICRTSEAGAAECLRQGLHAARGTVDPTIDMKTACAIRSIAGRGGILHPARELMKTNPPDKPMRRLWRKMASIGIVPGSPSIRASSIRTSPRTSAAGRLRPHHAALQDQRRRVKSPTAGDSPSKQACMAPTTSSAPWSPPLGLVPTVRRMPSTRHRKEANRQRDIGHQQICHELQERPDPARRWLLVADHV